MSDDRGMDPADFFASVFRVEGCECGCQDRNTNGKSTTNPELIDFVENMWEIIDHCGNVLISKQEDYGPTNISRAPGGPLNGLRVRIYDKVARINNLIDTGATPKNESLYDSFLDLANYAIIAMMVLDGVWPDMETE